MQSVLRLSRAFACAPLASPRIARLHSNTRISQIGDFQPRIFANSKFLSHLAIMATGIGTPENGNQKWLFLIFVAKYEIVEPLAILATGMGIPESMIELLVSLHTSCCPSCVWMCADQSIAQIPTRKTCWTHQSCTWGD